MAVLLCGFAIGGQFCGLNVSNRFSPNLFLDAPFIPGKAAIYLVINGCLH